MRLMRAAKSVAVIATAFYAGTATHTSKGPEIETELAQETRRQVSGQVIDLYDYCFKDRSECILFIFPDGKIFRFRTDDEDTVNIPLVALVDAMKGAGHDISECSIIIHNHLKQGRPSDGDFKTLARIKEFGFAGRIGIYFQPTKEWLEYE